MRMCRITSQQGQPVTFKTEFQTDGIFLFQAHAYGTTSVMSANWSICTLSDAYIVNKNFHSNSHQILGFVEKLTLAKMKQGISSRQFPYAKIRILPHFEKIH